MFAWSDALEDGMDVMRVWLPKNGSQTGRRPCLPALSDGNRQPPYCVRPTPQPTSLGQGSGQATDTTTSGADHPQEPAAEVCARASTHCATRSKTCTPPPKCPAARQRSADALEGLNRGSPRPTPAITSPGARAGAHGSGATAWARSSDSGCMGTATIYRLHGHSHHQAGMTTRSERLR